MADSPTAGGGAFELNAGRLCLDFTNTVRARPLSDKIELIHDYGDLLSWARQATILTPGEAAALAETARRQPRAAAGALTQARSLWEALYGLFSARAAGLLPAPTSTPSTRRSARR